MTLHYFPFSDADVNEAEWIEMARLWLGTGVIKTYNSAIDLNLLEVYGDSSGMQVKVKTGCAWIDGHFVRNDAEATLAIGAAHATLIRWDRVVLRVDRSANTIVLAILAGTPSGSPAVPALTQNSTVYEISLAYVVVGAAVSTITSGNVNDERSFQSNVQPRIIPIICADDVTAPSVASKIGNISYTVSPELHNWRVVDVWVSNQGAASSSGTPTFKVNKNGVNMLSTDVVLDINEKNSWTAATPAVIDPTKRTLSKGDLITLQCTVVGTGTLGATLFLVIQPPLQT